MSQKRRRASPLPFVGLSLLLILIPASTSQKARLTALSLFRPVQKLAYGSVALPSRVLPGGSREEDRAQIEYLQTQVQRLINEKEIAQSKLESLSATRQLLKAPDWKLLPADVLFPTDGSPWRKSLVIALGSRDGVEKGMLVLYHNYLVGRVAEVGPFSSRVQVVTDPAFKASAVAAPKTYQSGVSLEKRHVGVYEGTAGQSGRLKWLMGETVVENDATILTTENPANGIPRGLILGRVSKVDSGRGATLHVEVEPFLNFRALEHVTVLAGTAP
jgi:rod shape-determining protein MreC